MRGAGRRLEQRGAIKRDHAAAVESARGAASFHPRGRWGGGRHAPPFLVELACPTPPPLPGSHAGRSPPSGPDCSAADAGIVDRSDALLELDRTATVSAPGSMPMPAGAVDPYIVLLARIRAPPGIGGGVRGLAARRCVPGGAFPPPPCLPCPREECLQVWRSPSLPLLQAFHPLPNRADGRPRSIRAAGPVHVLAHGRKVYKV